MIDVDNNKPKGPAKRIRTWIDQNMQSTNWYCNMKRLADYNHQTIRIHIKGSEPQSMQCHNVWMTDWDWINNCIYCVSHHNCILNSIIFSSKMANDKGRTADIMKYVDENSKSLISVIECSGNECDALFHPSFPVKSVNLLRNTHFVSFKFFQS